MAAGGTKLAISGCEPSTSNNRMELKGVIEGLLAVGQTRAQVTIYTDSAYVKNPHTKGWLTKWQANGWMSHKGDPIANQDLWEQLLPLVARHRVIWKKVKGHTKVYSLNHLADQMAVQAKRTQTGVVELS